MRVWGRKWNHLDDRHHAAILVRQDVAVNHVLTGVVDEATAHPEVTRNDNSFRVGPTPYGDRSSRRDREHVPPDKIGLRRAVARLPAFGLVNVQFALARLRLTFEDVFVVWGAR